MNENRMNTHKEIIASLKIIHLTMMVGVAIFYIISFFLVKQLGPFGKLEQAAGQTILIGFLLIAALLVILAYIVHSRKIKTISQLPIQEKLQVYRTSLILKLAMLEGSVFLGIATYLMIGLVSVFAATAIIMMLLLLNHPTADQLSTELGLNPPEISDLQD